MSITFTWLLFSAFCQVLIKVGWKNHEFCPSRRKRSLKTHNSVSSEIHEACFPGAFHSEQLSSSCSLWFQIRAEDWWQLFSFCRHTWALLNLSIPTKQEQKLVAADTNRHTELDFLNYHGIIAIFMTIITKLWWFPQKSIYTIQQES